MRLRMPLRGVPASAQQVHAYVDGELSPPDRQAFEARVRAESEVRTAVQDALRVKALVGNLPETLEPPRSFRLTVAMVGAPARPRQATLAYQSLRRGATALAGISACVLAAAVVMEVRGGSGSGDGNSAATAAESNLSGSAAADARPAGSAAVTAAASATGVVETVTAAATVPPPPRTGGVSGQTVGEVTPAPVTKAAGIGPTAEVASPDDAAVEAATSDELTLTNEFAFEAGEGTDGGTNWRRVALVASLAGSILGSIGAFALRRKGDPA